MNVLEGIKKYKLVPVVVLNSVEEALPTMEALISGGLPVAEVCFRTECAKDSIKLLSEKYPEALIGAGTVINKKQCEEAITSGAKFIVSPGLSKEVFEVCKKNNVPYLPGVVTPTEIMEALSLGLTTLKFFPASNYGGLKTIKALSSAFRNAEFMPTGGIDESNILEYLSFNKIIACGGSFILKGSYEDIKNKTKATMKLIRGE